MNRIKAAGKYFVLTNQALQVAMAYRVRFFMSLLSGLIQVLVLYYIWRVVYARQAEIHGFTLSGMVTYIFISYAVRTLYSFHTETAISRSIRDGSVTLELIRPLNYQAARFFESLGSVLVEGVLTGLLVLALGFGLFGITPPPTLAAGALFGVSLALSLLVNFSLSYLVGLVSFWTTSLFGIVNSKRFIMDFFSGGLVPLAFFPAWLEEITYTLPFYAIVHVPVSIYLGKLAGNEAYLALLHQAIWAVVLWGLGSLMWAQASKKITIYGG